MHKRYHQQQQLKHFRTPFNSNRIEMVSNLSRNSLNESAQLELFGNDHFNYNANSHRQVVCECPIRFADVPAGLTITTGPRWTTTNSGPQQVEFRMGNALTNSNSITASTIAA